MAQERGSQIRLAVPEVQVEQNIQKPEIAQTKEAETSNEEKMREFINANKELLQEMKSQIPLENDFEKYTDI
ncbi:MAG: hypothetical protein E7K04_05355 [Helicobacter sp.]|nr:hypothetical protein [Helicobacter sp.]